MKLPSLLLTLILLCSAFPAEAAKPTRRSILQEGQQRLEEHKEQVMDNSIQAANIVYKTKDILLLGYSFNYPELWTVGMDKDIDSKFGQYYSSDGDYVYITEEQYDEDYAMFIYSKKFTEVTTLETVKKEWEDNQKQPDHDNVYEYSHLSYIRELDNVTETEITFLGKPALQLEYTFNNWSKFWKTHAIKFPWGKRVYTIKYRAELGSEDRFLKVYQELLNSFTFHLPEPQFSPRTSKSDFADVPSSHRNRTAIERLRELKIVEGYQDGTFRPDSTINRAEFIKIITSEPLVPAEELASCDTSPFPDVPSDTWFTQHVCVGKAREMIGGYPDGTFRPEKTISFVEAAKIIASFFEEVQEEEGEWYRPFVRGLERRRAIPISIQSLSSSVSRGEMSEMIYRLYDKVEGESLILEELE